MFTAIVYSTHSTERIGVAEELMNERGDEERSGIIAVRLFLMRTDSALLFGRTKRPTHPERKRRIYGLNGPEVRRGLYKEAQF